MKVQEFVENRNKFKTMTIKNVINTKKYLPFLEKQNLVSDILDNCKEVNNGYTQFNEAKKYILFTIGIIQAYTNLEFNDSFDIAIAEYDALCEADLLNDIIETFEGEYKTVLNMLGIKQDYILQQNSIECQIAQFLNGLNGKLDKFLENVSNQFSGYKDMNITPDDISKLTDFISQLGK